MKKSKKPKYKFGAFLKQNAQPISQVTGLAGQLINTEDPNGAAVSGVLQGAGAGAAFGPAGAIVGGLVGGATSFFGAEEAQKRKKELQQQKENAVTSQLISNAGNAYAKGGKLNNLSSKLGVIEGGELEPISKDAVEVKANNPNQTDSVELENAFVDHNEVIDRKNRVFSDELGFAKLAKKLEKQKSKSSRFAASNKRIEQQLDSLFQEQESMKKGMRKGGKYKMLTGGELTDPEEKPKQKVSRITNQPYINEIEYTRQQFLDNKIPSNEEYVLSYFQRNPKATRVLSGTSIDKNGGKFPNQVVDAFTDQLQTSTMMNPKGDTAMYMAGDQLPATDNPMIKTKKAKGGRLQLNGAFPMKPLKDKLDIGGTLRTIPKLNTVPKLEEKKLGEDPLKKYNPETRRNRVKSIVPSEIKTQDLSQNIKPINPNIKPVSPELPKLLKLPEIPEMPQSAVPMTLASTPSKDLSNKNSGIDISKGISTLATFAPNLVSAIAQRNLRGPAAPQMESTTRLERMSANDQLANADRQGLLADQLIKNNTAQGADIASATGNILAKKLASKNQIYGENQRINAAIQGQEAALNTQIKARNTERMNQFNNDFNDFSNLKTRLGTDNIANLSSKILQQGREKNQMELDKFAIKYMGRKFKDSGVPYRDLDEFTDEELEARGLQRKPTGKNGGIIPKKLAKKKK